MWLHSWRARYQADLRFLAGGEVHANAAKPKLLHHRDVAVLDIRERVESVDDVTPWGDLRQRESAIRIRRCDGGRQPPAILRDRDDPHAAITLDRPAERGAIHRDALERPAVRRD